MEGTLKSGADEKGFLVLWIIWTAMLGSLFIYVFICHQWGDQLRQTMSPNFPLDVMRKILYGIALFTLLLTHFVRKLILHRRAGSPQPVPSHAPGMTSQPTPLAKYSIAMIVSLALSESIGIYGFVLFVLGDSFQTLHIFIGISAIAMFYYRPKREELETLTTATQMEATSTPEL